MDTFVESAFYCGSKIAKLLSPSYPVIARLLLVSTFIEDGVTVMLELGLQRDFLRREYGIPYYMAALLIICYLSISLSAALLLVSCRDKFQRAAAHVLVGCTIYQQIMYGRHSLIISGNAGFFVRNLCLCGAILLVSCDSSQTPRQSLLDINPRTKKNVPQIQLASRILLVLLTFEFVYTLGAWATFLTLPVVACVLLGFHVEINASILLALYVLHNIINSNFWHPSHSDDLSEIMQYE